MKRVKYRVYKDHELDEIGSFNYYFIKYKAGLFWRTLTKPSFWYINRTPITVRTISVEYAINALEDMLTEKYGKPKKPKLVKEGVLEIPTK